MGLVQTLSLVQTRDRKFRFNYLHCSGVTAYFKLMIPSSYGFFRWNPRSRSQSQHHTPCIIKFCTVFCYLTSAYCVTQNAFSCWFQGMVNQPCLNDRNRKLCISYSFRTFKPTSFKIWFKSVLNGKTCRGNRVWDIIV